MTPGDDRAPPPLLADAMLERLARWLRVLGLDVASADKTLPDDAVVRLARAERRVVLTRDRRLAAAHPDLAVLVRANAPRAQVVEVAERFGMRWPGEAALFRRCLVCNAPLRAATPAEVAAQAAPVAVARGEAFSACPVCGRVYWEGGHTRRMRWALAEAFGVPREVQVEEPR